MDYFSVNNLNVTLGGKQILRGLTLSVRHGELLSILGPSGCGKSTLLKAVAGLIPPEGGEIFIAGCDQRDVPAEKRGAVIVFQDLRLFPHLSVGDNIAFNLKMKKQDKKTCDQTVYDYLEKVGLAGLAKRKVHTLSGGQQQRVALARALAAEPRMLLLDEPFSSLDENLRQKMRELVLVLHRELGLTTILVTHNPEEAFMMSDRIAVMKYGQILQCEKPQTIYDHPKSLDVAAYFGDMNYLSGTASQGVFTCSTHWSFRFTREGLPDGAYTLLLKPSRIKMTPADTSNDPWRVVSVYYRGDTYRLRVSDDAGTTELVLAVPADSGPAAVPGDIVHVEPEFDSGVFFKEASAC